MVWGFVFLFLFCSFHMFRPSIRDREKNEATTFLKQLIVQSILWSHNILAATWQNKQSDCAPSEDSDQPGHSPSLIRVFAVRMKKPWVLSYPLSAQQRLWSDWADAQADLSRRWAHTHFVGFVMSRLIWIRHNLNAESLQSTHKIIRHCHTNKTPQTCKCTK